MQNTNVDLNILLFCKYKVPCSGYFTLLAQIYSLAFVCWRICANV